MDIKNINVNNFDLGEVISAYSKQKTEKSSKKNKKSKKKELPKEKSKKDKKSKKIKQLDELYGNDSRSSSWDDDPTEKFLNDPKEIENMLIKYRKVSGPIIIDIKSK